MHASYIGNLLAVFSAKIALALLVIMMSAHDGLVAQSTFRKDNYNFLDFQQKPYYFGITLGFNSSRFKPFRSDEFLENDSILIVEGIGGPGFNLGIVTNLKIGEYFDFRLLPTLSFTERSLRYDRRPGPNSAANFSERRISSVFVEVPFHIRYKSAPFKDKRVFVIAGIKYGFDVASDSRSRQAETLIKVAPSDFAVEYGGGVQFFLPYFIFSPEIKFSHGLGNTLIYNANLDESAVLGKLLSRTITISLHFEG